MLFHLSARLLIDYFVPLPKNKIQKMQFKKLCLSAFMLGASLSALAQATPQQRLIQFFQHLGTYNVQFTHEQVYVHLDNNAYFENDTIYFSANVVYASNLKPTQMSRVLYVELLNDAGDLVQQRKVHIVNGRANGEFMLEAQNHTGFYEVRAYTRPMLNWGDGAIFSRVIPVFKQPQKVGDFHNLSIEDVITRPGLEPERKRPVPSLPAGGITNKGLCFALYPEGGNFVKGLGNATAFKVTDKKGNAVDAATCSLYSASGALLGTAATIHEGMGRIQMPETAEGGYVMVEKTGEEPTRFNLPAYQAQGASLHVASAVDRTDSLKLECSKNDALPDGVAGISILCRGRACYFDTLHLKKAPITLSVARKALGPGINQVTLFSSTGEVLAEREVWNETPELLQLDIKQNDSIYKPFSPIVLDMTLKDGAGKAVEGNFSLSVREQSGELVARGTGIRTGLLLSSDIKGYLHHPEYYFEATDAAHLTALDLLISVQGWKRFDWQEEAGIHPIELKYPVEDGMLTYGRLVDGSSKKRARAGYDIDALLQLPGLNKFFIGRTTTDSLGNFSFRYPSFFGEGTGTFKASKNDKSKYSLFALNRQSNLIPRPYFTQEMQLTAPVFTSPKTKAMQLFEWKDTIKSTIHYLPEVRIFGTPADKRFSGIYSWNGGENALKPNADIYYNAETELERYMDSGEEVPGIWEWLFSKNNVQYNEPEYYELDGDKAFIRLNGKKTYIFVNNQMYHPNKDAATLPIFLDEIKSLIISQRPELLSRYYLDSNCAIVFLYSSPYPPINHSRGMRVVHLHGYAYPMPFEGPNYRTMDMPNPNDYRRTLYWNPDVATNAQGKAVSIFYSNARPGQSICISAQGLTPDGRFIDLER